MPSGSLTQLDRYLAGTMSDSEELEHRLQAVGETHSAVRAAARNLLESSAAFRDPLTRTVQEVVSVFGEPTAREGSRVLYQVMLWPEHWFQWRFGGSDRVTDQAFVRRDARPVERPAELTLSSLRQTLEPWYHTAQDARQVLGPPLNQEDWWPSLLQEFGVSGARSVRLSFEHGLLTSFQSA